MTLKHAFLGVMATGLLAFACDVDRSSGDNPAGYYFTGTVYDGLTGKPLEEYKISLKQAAGTTTVEVNDESGAYEIGPVKPGSDYVITIDAGNDYRPFFAAESLKSALPTTEDGQVTQFYEAYVFPESLNSPAVTLELYGTYSNTARPSGQVRFAPAQEGNSALSLSVMTPSVGAQAWSNDADRKVGTEIIDFEEGVLDIEEGKLVYGVTYTGTVFDVAGHAYKSFNYTAGATGHQTIVLDNLADEPLQLISRSNDTGEPSEDGTVVYTFNQPIEFSPSTPDYVVRELIDDRITISGADGPDSDDVGNILIRDSATTEARDNVNDQERRTSIEIDGNTLTISWKDRNGSSFEPNQYDEDDLKAVNYSLTGISIRRVGATDGETVTLSSLTGNTVTVQLKEPLAP